MSIFGKIRDAIFGHKAATAAPAPAAPTTPTTTTASAAPTGSAPSAAPAAGAGAAPAATPVAPPMSQVDVEAVLTDLAARQPQKLNWRTSIVDLMKLLGLDAGLSERQALAQELGYTGDTHDTATMNIWLHKQVMKKLADNGGKVPADLLH